MVYSIFEHPTRPRFVRCTPFLPVLLSKSQFSVGYTNMNSDPGFTRYSGHRVSLCPPHPHHPRQVSVRPTPARTSEGYRHHDTPIERGESGEHFEPIGARNLGREGWVLRANVPLIAFVCLCNLAGKQGPCFLFLSFEPTCVC